MGYCWAIQPKATAMYTCKTCNENVVRSNTYIVDGNEVSVCDACVWKGAAKDMVRLFKVPTYNIPVLDTKFKKLARRATKLNLPAPTYTVMGESRLVRVKELADGSKKETVILLKHIIVNSGTNIVKVDGWEF